MLNEAYFTTEYREKRAAVKSAAFYTNKLGTKPFLAYITINT